MKKIWVYRFWDLLSYLWKLVLTQEEQLTSAIMNFRDVNSNDKKKQLLVDSPKFLQHKFFCLK